MGRVKKLKLLEVLNAIHDWILQNGFAPTVEELRSTLNLGSTRTVLRYLTELESEGMIERWSGARGIRILKQPTEKASTISVPIVGTAPAGDLMLASEHIDGWVRLPQEFLKPASGKFFVLRVRGNSMNRAKVDGGLIENGDLAVVRQQSDAMTNEIIVALVDGEATIKRLARGDGYYVLKPESSDPTHSPIILVSDFRIQGVVVRVLKKGSELLDITDHGEIA